MSAIGSLFNPSSGAGFQAQQAQLQNPTTVAQANQQYQNAQQALAQQQAFLQAVQAQGGLQNQANVFGQLQNVAAGQGPNPAQAQLAQATGANTANQAALMASQRGVSANPGLIARQAAQQGGANQQQAAGQAATLQAQQSLGALGQLGNLANQQVAQQAAATGAYTGATQGEQGQILGGIQAQNQAAVQNVSQANQANAQIQAANAQMQGNILGGLASGAAAALLLAKGGEVPKYDSGGPVAPLPPSIQDIGKSSSGPASKIGQYFNQIGSNSNAPLAQTGSFDLGKVIGQGVKSLFSSPAKSPTPSAGPDMNANPSQLQAAHGGKVPAMVSPGEEYLSPKDVKEVKKGKHPLAVSEKIPGKAKVKGDSYKNDTVPKTLEAGGIVIPKSVMESDDAPANAAKFVAAILKQHSLKKSK